MTKAGKNQAAIGARANRNNIDTKSTAHRHGRAGKHEFREWGDRHGGATQLGLPSILFLSLIHPY